MSNNKQDLDVLTIVRKFLVEISGSIYRNYEFFFQAENKEQRRKIYNERLIFKQGKIYSVVCKSLCDMIAEYLVSNYGLNVKVITCDNDEFGHYDILVNDKYIINCLSDLERTQIGMKPKRFASYKYCLDRYPDKVNELSFLSEEEIYNIDKEIGYNKDGYLDDAISLLKSEFLHIKGLLNDNNTNLKELLIDDSTDIITDEVLLKTKINFLLKYFNIHGNIIGHIELVRVLKMFIKELFNEEERKSISCYNCFTDCDIDNNIFNGLEKRKRFIAINVYDTVYLISVMHNSYMKMTANEWNTFKTNNNVFSKTMMSSDDNISEVLRNKGIGVNIMKHSVVNEVLSNINDYVMDGKNNAETKELLDLIASQENKVEFTDSNNNYAIELCDSSITIIINDDFIKYYYLDDCLVSEDPYQQIKYKWIDEGKYKNYVYRKDKN